MATRGICRHETGVPRKPGAGHLHCASSVDPGPPGAGSCRRAWNDSRLIEGELVCFQKRQVRRTGSAWNRKQALLYQLVGYDMALRPSTPQEGGPLASRVLHYVRFDAMKCADGVHSILVLLLVHTFCAPTMKSEHQVCNCDS